MTRIITYSFAPANLVFPANWGYSMAGTLTKSWSTVYSGFAYKAKTRAAFDRWAATCDMGAFELPDPGTAPGASTEPHVRFHLGAIDAPTASPNVQAFAFYSHESGGRASDITFENDAADVAFAQMTNSGGFTYFYSLITHELGHAIIDMPHNTEPGSVLNGIGNAVPSSYDAWWAANKYGAATTNAQKLAQGKALGIVWSLYKGGTNGNPDLPGTAYWVNGIKAGTRTALGLASALVGNLAGLATPDFIWFLYDRILARAATSTELSYWGTRVSSVGRAQVFLEIADSPEAATRRQAVFSGSTLWW
ncbi:hypothetical protein DEM27_12465 [Metarhizobium album]|uniref:DUF4214 domain-containing protein n=1 Tax=Metarhizobium album TaxID=2182425 RepID=A0A2U2DSD7_9HYPH|nr:DUF4214 domain-containing protein [Rhizobium album]PWE56233.1 hypothetical protein DEM27_12465 [Rhizobium album]